MSKILISVPAELEEALRARAAADKMPLSELARQALSNYLGMGASDAQKGRKSAKPARPAKEPQSLSDVISRLGTLGQ